MKLFLTINKKTVSATNLLELGITYDIFQFENN